VKNISNKSLYIALFLVAVIVVITLISASNIGFEMKKETVTSIQKDQMILIQKEGYPYPPTGKGVRVQTITATNSIIPRRIPIGRVVGCLVNTQTGEGVDVGARFEYPAMVPQREFEIPPGEILDIGIGETKSIAINIMPFVVYIPKTPGYEKPQPQDFDTLYLFVSETEEFIYYPQCYNLPEEQKAMADAKIPLV